MAATKAVTHYCPHCKAPNPPVLDTCYVCGRRFRNAELLLAPVGTNTYLCANCAHPVPLQADACPHCGRLAPGEPGAV